MSAFERPDRPAFLADLSDEELEALARAEEIADTDDAAALELAGAIATLEENDELHAWRNDARHEQILPESFTVAHLRGGRGAGKGWAASHNFAERLLADADAGEYAVVAPSFSAARDICIEGEAGLLAAFNTSLAEVIAGRSRWVEKWLRSHGELRLRHGVRVFIDGADDGARSIQGRNLSGCWADEIGLWRDWETAWDESIGFALRKGESFIIATGTPKAGLSARALVRRLLDDPDVVNRRLRTLDNLPNLSPAYKARYERWEGTALGLQELEGELRDEVEGALWRQSWIEENRVDAPPVPLLQIVVGLDPAEGGQSGAEQALAVIGAGLDGFLYLLDSTGHRESPLEWAKRAVRTARDLEPRGRLVVEKNAGGKWLLEVLDQAKRELGCSIAVTPVTATESKRTRAEPIASLTEAGRIKFVGHHVELEEQLVGWTGGPRDKSPDRLDAFVHAATALMPQARRPYSGDHDPGHAVPYTTAYAGEDGAVPWVEAAAVTRPGTWDHHVANRREW